MTQIVRSSTHTFTYCWRRC